MGYGIDRGFGYKDSPREATVCDVAEEVVRAREKFPDATGLLAALMEEVGELAQAMLQSGPRSDRAKKEATQVAAVALRIIEEGDPLMARVPASSRKA